MKFKTLFFAIIVLLFSSCKKEYAPYSIFKKSSYKTIKTESIDVNLNDHYYLIIDNGFKSSKPVYSLQKNNDSEQIISNSTMVSQESHGWNGTKQLKVNVVRVHLNFDSNLFNVGDQLKIFSQHGSVSEFLTFRIK